MLCDPCVANSKDYFVVLISPCVVEPWWLYLPIASYISLYLPKPP